MHRFFSTAALLMAIVVSMVGFALPLLAMKIGASVFQLGLIGTVGGLCYMVSCVFTGRMADRFRPKGLMLLGGLLYAVLYAGIVYATQVWQVLVVVGLGGMSSALFWPPLAVWIAEGREQKKLAQALGGYNVAWCAGILIGPLAGGTLFGMDFRLPFWTGALVDLALMGILLTVPDKVNCAQNPALEEEPQTTRLLYAVWVANFAGYFIIGVLRNIFPKLALQLGITPGVLGLLLATISLTQLVTFLLFRRAEALHYKLTPLIAAHLLGIGAMILIILTDRLMLLALSFALSGVLVGTTYSMSLFHSLYGGVRRGAKSGLNEAIVSSGFLIGPFTGGLVAKFFNLKTPYALCALILGMAMIIEPLLIHEVKNEKTSEESHGHRAGCDYPQIRPQIRPRGEDAQYSQAHRKGDLG